jgi:hypothetical protein
MRPGVSHSTSVSALTRRSRLPSPRAGIGTVKCSAHERLIRSIWRAGAVEMQERLTGHACLSQQVGLADHAGVSQHKVVRCAGYRAPAVATTR